MGFRHTSESQCSYGVVCGADGGPAEVVEDAVMPPDFANAKDGHLEPAATESRSPGSGSRNLGVQIALFALRVYKAYLSVLFAGTCRFEPTCSQYTYQAIEKFGALRGVWLGTKRLARCHPLSGKFGYDPVPDEFSEKVSDDRRTQQRDFQQRDVRAASQAIGQGANMKGGIRL